MTPPPCLRTSPGAAGRAWACLIFLALLSGCRPSSTGGPPNASPATPPEAATASTPATSEGDVALQIAALNQRRITEPRNAGLLVELGRLYSRVGHLHDALAAFDDASKLDPKLVPAFLGQGQTWRELGRPQRAIHAYEQAARLLPDQSLIELELTGAYIDLRDFPAAQLHAERAQKLAPSEPEVYRALGTVYSATGNITATTRAGQKAIDLAPTDVHNWVQMGALCYGVRRFADAARYLRRAVEMDPTNIDANVNLADCLRQLDQTPTARREVHALLSRALTLNPRHERALFLLGRIYLEDGKTELALSTLRRAVRWSPQSREVLLALGQALTRSGKTVEGRALLARAQHAIDTTVDFRGLEYQVHNNPNPDVYARLVQLYMQNHYYDSALHAVEQGLRAAPKDQRLLALRTKLVNHPPALGGAH